MLYQGDVMKNDPIFIGGMQRSGTSLMRAIVGSHPDIAIFEWDLPLWTYFFDRFRNLDLTNSVPLAELIDEIFSHEKIKACHVTLNRSAVEMRISEQADRDITCGLVFKCFLEEYAHRIGKPRWGLKTPHNEFYADKIFTAYPNARMVQMIRDPRDVAVSYKSYNNGSWYYSPKAHIDKWKKSIELSQENSYRYKGRYLCVRYEDLVKNPEKTIRGVCGTLDIEFRYSMLDMDGQLGWKGNNSFFDDIGMQSRGISTCAIARYRTQLQPYLVYLYQKRLGMHFIRLDYEVESYSNNQHLKYGMRRAAELPRQWILSLIKTLTKRSTALLRGTEIYVPVRTFYRRVIRPIAQHLYRFR